MKQLALLAAALSLCGCAPEVQFAQQDLYILTADSFETATSRGDFGTALESLGDPMTTQVNLRACPVLAFDTIIQVKRKLERAGFTRIGFAAAEELRCSPRPN